MSTRRGFFRQLAAVAVAVGLVKPEKKTIDPEWPRFIQVSYRYVQYMDPAGAFPLDGRSFIRLDKCCPEPRLRYDRLENIRETYITRVACTGCGKVHYER